jgi:hypothetical protein
MNPTGHSEEGSDFSDPASAALSLINLHSGVNSPPAFLLRSLRSHSSSSSSPAVITPNLLNFLRAVTPSFPVSVRTRMATSAFCEKIPAPGVKSSLSLGSSAPFVDHDNEADSDDLTLIDFHLRDLWKCYDEPYGHECTLVIGGRACECYFVPYLSCLQVIQSEKDTLLMSFTEKSPPHQRVPLWDKITELANDCPLLLHGKASQLNRLKSFFCISWYPLLVDHQTSAALSGSFLTFHAFQIVGECPLNPSEMQIEGSRSPPLTVSSGASVSATEEREKSNENLLITNLSINASYPLASACNCGNLCKSLPSGSLASHGLRSSSRRLDLDEQDKGEDSEEERGEDEDENQTIQSRGVETEFLALVGYVAHRVAEEVWFSKNAGLVNDSATNRYGCDPERDERPESLLAPPPLSSPVRITHIDLLPALVQQMRDPKYPFTHHDYEHVLNDRRR